MTTDPEELDPVLDAELGTADDDLDEDLDGDGLPDGFVVEGGDEDDEMSVDDDDVDVGATIIDVVEAAVEVAAEDPDDFEEELAPIVRVPDEEDDAPARRSGEFVCSRCYLVKRDSQLAVRSRKVCRDCA